MSARRTPPSVGREIGAAAVLAVAGAALLAALAVSLGPGAALRAVIALMSFAYVLYLLATSAERVGRITTVALWVACAAAVWFAPVPLAGFVLIHASLAWLVRSLYFAHGLCGALAELALTAFGLACAVWAASRTGSALLAFWCFFLAQAFHGLLPAGRERSAAVAPDDARAFARAERAAEAALRRMSAAR
jgi:hypothetical protein